MPPELTEEGLKRRLKTRHLSMIAIGGAIGVGLFLGSSLTISQAGPGVLLSYILGALIALVVAYALAEMAVVHPVAGSFGVYAERYLCRWAGFSVRLTYGACQIVAIGAEVTAVAIYFAYWFPAVPQWLFVGGVSLGLIAINAADVGRFGEFEYWFALIKVVAILAFIAVGAALILGFGPGPPLGLKNLTAHGGFLPHGFRGVWLALTLALTSYMGVEVVAVTAGEAERPEESIPKAMRSIVFRLIVFYVLAITVMLAMSPWTQTGSGQLLGSPFVKAFAAAGIPFAAGLMNFVVITAALSSANTNLYLATRMLFSLARGGFVPQGFGELSSAGVPGRALAVSATGMFAAILLAVFAPARAFLMLYGTAVAGMLFVWIVVLLTHLRFRQALGTRELVALPLRLPAHPLPTLAGLLAVVAVAFTTFAIDGLRYSVPTFVPFLALVTLFYFLRSRGDRSPDPARGRG